MTLSLLHLLRGLLVKTRSMQLGFSGSLKQVGCFMRDLKSWFSYKFFVKESSMLALKSPNKITFSYLFKCISKPLETKIDKWESIFPHIIRIVISHLFFLRFNSIKKLLVGNFSIEIVFDGVSLRTKSIIPSPFLIRSSLYGLLYPSRKNWLLGKESSVFDSDTISTSIIPLIRSISWSNLFLIELILSYANKILFKYPYGGCLIEILHWALYH